MCRLVAKLMIRWQEVAHRIRPRTVALAGVFLVAGWMSSTPHSATAAFPPSQRAAIVLFCPLWLALFCLRCFWLLVRPEDERLQQESWPYVLYLCAAFMIAGVLGFWILSSSWLSGVFASIERFPITKEEIIGVVSCLCITTLLFRLGGRPLRRGTVLSHENHLITVTQEAPASYKLSPFRRKHTAYHEAGHILAYALLPEDKITDTLMVRVKTIAEAPDFESFGYVTGGFRASDSSTEEKYLVWDMMMLLMGMQAERLLLGGALGYGPTGDNSEWMELAGRYLAGGHDGPYHLYDIGSIYRKWKVVNKINHTSLRKLKEKQLASVNEFLRRNTATVEDLAVALLEKDLMLLPDLAPYFNRVRTTEGLEILSGGRYE